MVSSSYSAEHELVNEYLYRLCSSEILHQGLGREDLNEYICMVRTANIIMSE